MRFLMVIFIYNNIIEQGEIVYLDLKNVKKFFL